METADTSCAEWFSRLVPAISTRAIAACCAGRVERLLVSFVPFVAKVVDK